MAARLCHSARMARASVFTLLPFVALAACQPPASDEYVERSRIAQSGEGASQPITSPDTTGAIWAPGGKDTRLLYGKPGERPLFAIECVDDAAGPRIAYTRFAAADPHAKALLALIGNGHVARFKIDAVQVNDAWLWQGSVEADIQGLDALTGTRDVEATVPGAGSIILNASALPGELVENCRAQPNVEPTPGPSAPEDPA